MKPLYVFAKGLLTPVFGCFFHTTYVGRKRRKNRKPLIFVGNHLALSDTVVLGISHNRQLYYLGKKELVEPRFSGAVLRGLGIVPVSRGAADIDAMRTVLGHLKQGHDIAIYPEGTRNKRDNRLCRIYGGAAMFAIKTKTAIVPFAFNRKACFLHRNYMLFGDPFQLSEFYGERLGSDTLAAADETVREHMIRVKRTADYLSSLRGKARRTLKKRLNDPAVSFDEIFESIEADLFPVEYSVAPDDFDQTIKPTESGRAAAKTR